VPRRLCDPSGVTRTTLIRPLTAAALLVALTGCFKIDMDLDISENETIDGEIILVSAEPMTD
jgi:hypothetical protein